MFGMCGKWCHISACHKHREADTELYERIRKKSRKRKGTSASGIPAAKRTKSVPNNDEKKDLENQLEKARL